MKKTCYIFILIFLAAFSYTGKCATQQWTFDGMSNIVQVFADGKGGCAITRMTGEINGTNQFDIVWLDKKGAFIYSRQLADENLGIILNCTSKSLLYTDHRPTPVFVQVDDKGTESIVPSDAGKYNMLPEVSMISSQKSPVYDKKGFFVVETGTNGMSATLVRYSNK